MRKPHYLIYFTYLLLLGCTKAVPDIQASEAVDLQLSKSLYKETDFSSYTLIVQGSCSTPIEKIQISLDGNTWKEPTEAPYSATLTNECFDKKTFKFEIANSGPIFGIAANPGDLKTFFVRGISDFGDTSRLQVKLTVDSNLYHVNGKMYGAMWMRPGQIDANYAAGSVDKTLTPTGYKVLGRLRY